MAGIHSKPPVAKEPASFAGTKRFEVVRILGFGGMGVVHEAFDHERRTRVALKTMLKMSGEALLLFKNEFRVLQDITHPNLIGLGELIEDECHLFFTMELVEGVDLLEYVRPTSAAGASGVIRRDQQTAVEGRALQENAEPISVDLPGEAHPAGTLEPGGFDERRLRSVLGQLALALSALHGAGKVHRDIKPSNILVTATERVVVLDFGLVTSASPARLGGPGPIVGTIRYMAPEQAAGLPVGPEADWYSVGALMYFALTGQHSFPGPLSRVLLQKQAHEPPPPSTLVVDLPADLHDLCVDLLRIDPRARPSAREVLNRLCPGAPSAPVGFGASAAAFVGRSAELGALDSALVESCRGRPVTVLIEGESGVGKSALAREFLEQTRSTGGLTVFAGRCYERESVPYKAVDEVIDVLSQWLAGLDNDDAAALMPANAHLLAHAFTVMAQVRAVADACARHGDAATAPRSRSLVFAAMRDLFARIAARSPLVMWIDDLQWADADSFALLGEVLRRDDADGPTPILFIATLRAGSANAARAALLPGVVHRLALSGLPEGDARELAAAIARRAAPGQPIDVDALTREAGGHPLFLDALLRHRLVHGGAGTVHLDEALHARVERLSAEVRRVFECVVIAGGPVPQGTVAEAVGIAFGDLARPLAELRTAHLIGTGGPGGDDFIEPFHDRVRESAAGRLAPAVRRAWHERLANALERRGKADSERLAVHWREAGILDKALDHTVRAADEAVRALAFDRAARLYRAAIALTTDDPGAARALRIRLGDALTHDGRGEDASAVRLLAARGAAPAQARELQRRAMENLFQCGIYERGVAALRELLAEVGMSLPRNAAAAIASLAVQRTRLRLRGLAFHEQPAARIDPGLLRRADVAWSAGMALGLVDTLRAADFQCRSLLLALEAGEPARIARGLAAEALFGALPGSRTRARSAAYLERADVLASRLDEPYVLAITASSRGIVGFLEGRFRRGLVACDRAEAVYVEHSVGAEWEQSAVQMFGLWCLWFLGDVEELSRRLPVLLRHAEERGDQALSTALRSAWTNAHWLLRGEVDEARRNAELAWRGFYPGLRLRHAYDFIARTQIDLYVGDGAAAHRRCAERFPAVLHSLALGIQTVRITLRDLRARAALSAARVSAPSARRRLLAGAASDADALANEGAFWATPLAALRHAGVAASRGDTEGAARLLPAAIRDFDAAEMTLYATAARVRLEQLGGDATATMQRLRLRGVVNPDRVVEMLAPGFR